MKVLLAGGAGYIASHTAVVLAQASHEVVLNDNLCNSHADMVKRLARIIGTSVVFIQGDVRDLTLLEPMLREQNMDAVIHFAGLKAVGESVVNPLSYYDNNVTGTQCLLRTMSREDVRKLVFSSSATVCGEPRYLPLDEVHPASATNPYGRSKLHIEEFLTDLGASDASWRIACLRYFNPVGAHESGLIRENPKGEGVPDNLMPFVAQAVAGGRPSVNVFSTDYHTPDGTGVRDYIYVMDLADGHLAALDYLADHAGWQAFNLGAGRGYSVLEMIRAFEAVSSHTVPHEVVARRPGDVATSCASAEKARTLLHWRAHRNLHDMCVSESRWQQTCENAVP